MILWYAVAVHTIWGLLMLLVPGANVGHITAASATTYVLGDSVYLHGGLLLAASALACIGLRRAIRVRDLFGMLLFVPQQALMMMAGASATQCCLHSAYADGVLRPWAFIAADQSPTMILALWHTYALVAKFARWKT